MKLGQDEKRNVASWDKDAHAQCLRVQLADGGFYVFPYSRLQFARFEHKTEQDALQLLMDTHEIKVVGKNLRELGLALQKLSVEWMREMPARYATAPNHEDAYIASINVSEIQAQ